MFRDPHEQLLAMEEHADEWYRRLLNARRQLEDPGLTPEDRLRWLNEADKYERELKTLDEAIERRRAARRGDSG